MPADGRWDLTLILLTWRIWCAPNNASRWQMGFNRAFKGLSPKIYGARTETVYTKHLWGLRQPVQWVPGIFPGVKAAGA